MRVIRWLLIVLNAGAFVGGLVWLRGELRTFYAWDWGPTVLVFGALAVAALNALYIAAAPMPGTASRIGRMAGLWLSAKEADLEQRASRKQSD